MRDESHQVGRKWLYVAAPFCWLLLCLGTINVAAWMRATQAAEPLPVMITAVPTPIIPPPPTESGSKHISTMAQLTTTAIISPSPSLTPYAPPFYDANEHIQLLGPPPGSTFAQTAKISFYWQWPLPLTQDQYFNIYLFTEGETILLGTIDEPNVGEGYRLSVALEDVAITADTAYWFVQLETTQGEQPLRVSETRFLTILISFLAP